MANQTSVYKFIKRTPENVEFVQSVEGLALHLKKKNGKLGIFNAITQEFLWVTSDIQNETRSEDKKFLTIETCNTVYEFERFAETI